MFWSSPKNFQKQIPGWVLNLSFYKNQQKICSRKFNAKEGLSPASSLPPSWMRYCYMNVVCKLDLYIVEGIIFFKLFVEISTRTYFLCAICCNASSVNQLFVYDWFLCVLSARVWWVCGLHMVQYLSLLEHYISW